MDVLTAPLQIGTGNMGFSAQFPAKKGPENLTPKKCLLQEDRKALQPEFLDRAKGGAKRTEEQNLAKDGLMDQSHGQRFRRPSNMVLRWSPIGKFSEFLRDLIREVE